MLLNQNIAGFSVQIQPRIFNQWKISKWHLCVFLL